MHKHSFTGIVRNVSICALAICGFQSMLHAFEAPRNLHESAVVYEPKDAPLNRAFEIGFGIHHFTLYQPVKREYNDAGDFTGGFLGSIDRLNEEQNYYPRPFLRFNFNRLISVQMGYVSMRVSTSTYWGHSDGKFALDGPSFELCARHKFDSGLVPHFSIGYARMRAKFKHNELWQNGFSPANREPYDNWVAAGRPEWPNGGYRRTISVEDTNAWMLTGGCAYMIGDRWNANLELRHMALDVDAEFYLSWHGTNRRDQGTYNIPLDNWSVMLSLAYAF